MSEPVAPRPLPVAHVEIPSPEDINILSIAGWLDADPAIVAWDIARVAGILDKQEANGVIVGVTADKIDAAIGRPGLFAAMTRAELVAVSGDTVVMNSGIHPKVRRRRVEDAIRKRSRRRESASKAAAPRSGRKVFAKFELAGKELEVYTDTRRKDGVQFIGINGTDPGKGYRGDKRYGVTATVPDGEDATRYGLQKALTVLLPELARRCPNGTPHASEIARFARIPDDWLQPGETSANVQDPSHFDPKKREI